MFMETSKINILHTIRPLDYKNTCIEEIFLYIDILKKLGIKNINFNIKMFEKMGNLNEWEYFAKKIKKYVDELSMEILITHAPYENALILSNGFNEELILKTKMAIDVTKIFEAKTMVIHCGISYKENYDEELTINDNVEFWEDICDYANQNQIMVAFENDVVADDKDNQTIFKPAVTTVNKIVELLNKKQFNNVKLCYDIGHANISNRDIEKDLMLIKNNIGCFHIHNNFGHIDFENAWKNDVHNPCYNGKIDMESFFLKLKDIKNNNNIIIESVYRDSGLELETSIKKDYDYIEKLSKLLIQ